MQTHFPLPNNVWYDLSNKMPNGMDPTNLQQIPNARPGQRPTEPGAQHLTPIPNQPGGMPQLTPQMLATLALKNPELLASMLAAKGVHPNQLQLAQGPQPGGDQLNVGQPPVSASTLARPAGTPVTPPTAPQGGPPMAMPGPMTGPAAVQLSGGAPPMAPTIAQTQALMGGPQGGQPQLALGDILAGVKTPSVATQPRPGSAGQQQTSNLNPNVLALMQWLAQNGAAGGGVASPAVTPSLGQLLGR